MASNSILQAAVAATLVAGSAQSMATGYVNLPTSGASSAYIQCNTTGSYGSGTSVRPTTTANNTCAIFAEPSGEGYTQKTSATRTIIMNNTYTGNLPVVIGQLTDSVWYRASNNTYVIATRVMLDYEPYASLPILEDPSEYEDAYIDINDIQRSGFTGRDLSVAYRVDPATDEVLFRAGRTATAITAVTPYGLPNAAVAPWDADVVTFTTDISPEDPDGSSPRNSAHFYIKYPGVTGDDGNQYMYVNNAIKLKQMGQEGQPLIDINMSGYTVGAPIDSGGYRQLPTAGSSLYVTCNPTGNYGLTVSSKSIVTECSVPSMPEANGYTVKTSSTRNIVSNSGPTTFGSFQNKVWYKAADKTYIYGLRISLSNNGVNAALAINDVQLTGFANVVGPIRVGYKLQDSDDEVVFRAGRTATAVAAPLGTEPLPTASTAPFNSNVINFTTDVAYSDPDGVTNNDSAWMFVKIRDEAGNTSGTRFNTGSTAVKFKQMGQEGQPLVTIESPGFKPSF